MTDANNNDIERAFQTLAMYGVPRERARHIANGIDVLVTRMDRELAAVNADRLALVEAVIHYGRHHAGCNGTRGETCTCNFGTALQRAKGIKEAMGR